LRLMHPGWCYPMRAHTGGRCWWIGFLKAKWVKVLRYSSDVLPVSLNLGQTFARRKTGWFFKLPAVKCR
jgi:hypothetical protein